MAIEAAFGWEYAAANQQNINAERCQAGLGTLVLTIRRPLITGR